MTPTKKNPVSDKGGAEPEVPQEQPTWGILETWDIFRDNSEPEGESLDSQETDVSDA